MVGLTPPLTALITPEPVRHSRIPDLPLDSNLLFEALLFLYLLVALFVQYINIYRTVWWSSYSHPSASTSLVQSNHTHNITINISLLMYLLQRNTKGDVCQDVHAVLYCKAERSVSEKHNESMETLMNVCSGVISAFVWMILATAGHVTYVSQEQKTSHN